MAWIRLEVWKSWMFTVIVPDKKSQKLHRINFPLTNKSMAFLNKYPESQLWRETDGNWSSRQVSDLE